MASEERDHLLKLVLSCGPSSAELILPKQSAALLSSFARTTGVTDMMPLAALLGSVSVVMGAAYKAAPTENSTMKVLPTLWLASVGSPGSGGLLWGPAARVLIWP
jgi:hypothetical protein